MFRWDLIFSLAAAAMLKSPFFLAVSRILLMALISLSLSCMIWGNDGTYLSSTAIKTVSSILPLVCMRIKIVFARMSPSRCPFCDETTSTRSAIKYPREMMIIKAPSADWPDTADWMPIINKKKNQVSRIIHRIRNWLIEGFPPISFTTRSPIIFLPKLCPFMVISITAWYTSIGRKNISQEKTISYPVSSS